MRSRSDRIDEALGKFGQSITSTVALLEFKATLIRQLIIIHDQLRLKRRFTAARDALLEKQHRQSQLRAHIFNNLLAVSASSFEEMTPERDQRLAEENCLRIENHIREAYRWFRFKSTDAMASAINCTRAAEYPEKKRVRYLRIPRCKRGENKFCRVEAVIRTNLTLLRALKGYDDPKGEFERALSVADRVASDESIDLSHQDCRSAGDCLIALEAREDATHVMSTNATEWRVLSELCGYEFVQISYPEERTR